MIEESRTYRARAFAGTVPFLAGAVMAIVTLLIVVYYRPAQALVESSNLSRTGSIPNGVALT
ncbi:MAG: hypothetical protein OEO82_06900 [Gammaproteobacteria bacterium]|nr:hypothetical protein [Gammaproteobacteria bacterium]